MAEQAKQPQNNNQQPKPQSAPPPKKEVRLDQVLDNLFASLPMTLDEESGEIKIKTRDFGLIALALMGVGDIDMFTTFLRRRQQNARFDQAIEYQQNPG